MAPTFKPAFLIAAVLFLTPTLVSAQSGKGEPGVRSVLDGVYTEAQAERGKVAYRRHCAECHASGFFRGDPFRLIWSGQPVAGFFGVMSTSMPINNPASLKPEEYSAIVAYILQLNKYPAGEDELPSTSEALQLILIEDPSTGGGLQP